ncbi:MAG: hypothetical protein AAFQ91_04610 [Cyanobacteria bacterium J06621_15]
MYHHKFHVGLIGLVLLAGTFSAPAFATKSSPRILTFNTISNQTIRWKLDKSEVKIGKLTPLEKIKLHRFQNVIEKQGISPKDAALKIGDTSFKLMKSHAGTYQLSLSQYNRVFFTIDYDNHTVKILQVGGNVYNNSLSYLA